MPVKKLKDGRWIVYFYGWVGGKRKKLRQYYGRGPEAEIKAMAADQAMKADKVQALATAGVTFNNLATVYTKEKFTPSSGMSATDQTATYYKLHANILRFFGEHPALSIDEELCRKYLKKRIEQDGVMSVTVRREMQIVQAILTFATTKKAGRLIPYNPIAEDELPGIDSETIMPPTHGQVLKIYRNACPYLKRAILLGVNTGARIGASELLRIDWEDVDFAHNVINVVSAVKNRSIPYRRVAITPEFRKMLEGWGAEDAAARGIEVDDLSGPIIHYKGNRLKRLKMAWGKALAKTTIKRRIRPYDLRHFFATRMVEQGAGLEVTGQTMGHSDSKTTARYSASATPEQRAEIEKQVRMNRMVLDLEAKQGGRSGRESDN